MRNIVLGLALSAITITTKAQVAINTSGSNAASSAMLDVSSTSKGILISRMTGAQRKAIPNPETGLMVFDLDRSTIFMYDGAQWRPLTFSSEKKLPLVEREPDTDDNSVKLGNDVGMSGDYAIAGAPSEDSAGLFSIGAAYIYHRENGVWKLQQKLFPSNNQLTQFGSSVAIENDIAVVGSPYSLVGGQSLSGQVFIFKRNGSIWTQMQVLQLQTPQLSARFGCDVAIQNGRILVGVKGHIVNGLQIAGSVYLYEYVGNTWGIIKHFKASTPATNMSFGTSVGIYNNDVVIGVPGAIYNGVESGVLYVYTYIPASGLWSETILGPQIPKYNMELGFSVSIHNNTILAGIPFVDHTDNGNTIEKTGGAYSYKKTNGVWSYSGGIGNNEPEAYLGYSVATNETYFLRSAPGYDNNRGYVFGSATGGNNRYVDIDNETGTMFGASVAISGTSFIIGAPDKNNSRGSVVFGTFE